MLHNAEELKNALNFELQAMDDANKTNRCGSNSWLTCFRTLTSIFIGEIVSMSTYLAMHRALHGLSHETETLLLLGSFISGVVSGCAMWWSTGEVADYLNTYSNRIKLDELLDKINQIKQEKIDQDDELIGYPTSKTQQSKLWSFFKSCVSHPSDYQLLANKDDLEVEPRSNPIFD
jgi:hypothetical protein